MVRTTGVEPARAFEFRRRPVAPKATVSSNFTTSAHGVAGFLQTQVTSDDAPPLAVGFSCYGGGILLPPMLEIEVEGGPLLCSALHFN